MYLVAGTSSIFHYQKREKASFPIRLAGILRGGEMIRGIDRLIREARASPAETRAE